LDAFKAISVRMKLKLAMLLAFVNVAYADVELSGILTASDDSRFILSDTSANSNSDWLKIGESYHGYSIVSFDKDSGILDVRDGPTLRHLKLRVSKVAQSEPPPTNASDIERHKRIIKMYGSFGEMVLADLRADASFLYFTPREVWLGRDYAVGETIAIPRPKGFNWLIGSGGATWVFGFKPGNLFVPESPMMAAGTDGTRMGGQNGVPLDEFRAYYAPTPN
jgi:hypothetical protein